MIEMKEALGGIQAVQYETRLKFNFEYDEMVDFQKPFQLPSILKTIYQLFFHREIT